MSYKIFNTAYVFVKNNQVYHKKGINKSNGVMDSNEEWFPINFQWQPIVFLNNELNQE